MHKLSAQIIMAYIFFETKEEEKQKQKQKERKLISKQRDKRKRKKHMSTIVGVGVCISIYIYIQISDSSQCHPIRPKNKNPLNSVSTDKSKRRSTSRIFKEMRMMVDVWHKNRQPTWVCLFF